MKNVTIKSHAIVVPMRIEEKETLAQETNVPLTRTTTICNFFTNEPLTSATFRVVRDTENNNWTRKEWYVDNEKCTAEKYWEWQNVRATLDAWDRKEV